MRLLLLAFFVGLALAAKNNDEAFRAKHEYIYKYESQIVTGNIPSSHIHSGFKFTAWARVQFITYSLVRVQFDKIVMYSLEQPVVQYEADRNLNPSPVIREVVGPDSVTVVSYLNKPFGFTYDDGHVVKVHLSDDETWWSANAKRGFISLFEVNLEKRFELPEYFPPTNVKLPSQSQVYSVLEKSPEGECATIYSTQKSETSNDWYIFKTRDFDKCIDRPIYFNSMVDGFRTIQAIEDQPLTVQTQIHYNIKVLTPKKFIINNVVADESITFSPENEKLIPGEQGELRTSINQTLILMNSMVIPRNRYIEEIREGKHRAQSLRVTLPSRQVDDQQPFAFLREEPQIISNPYDVYSWEKIYTLLRMVADNNLDLTSDEGLTHLRALSDMLRTSPKEVLIELWNKLYTTRSAKDAVDIVAANIYFNLLPTLGTQPASMLLLDVCTSDITLTDNCTFALNVLTLKATPTPELIRQLVQLIKERRRTFPPAMKQVAYLTLGSFGYKLSKEKVKFEEQLQIAEELYKPLLKEKSRVVRNMIKQKLDEVKNAKKAMMNMYTEIGNMIVNVLNRLIERGNHDDKILGVKAMANSGLPFIIAPLKKIINNRSEQEFMRIMAVMGFRRIFFWPVWKLEAEETLFQIFTDHSEGHEIRNIAFVVLASLKPSLPIWQKIGNSMNYEKDLDVSSFVIRWMETYANSTYEPIWPYSKNISIALRTAPKHQPSHDHSFFKFWASYQRQYRLGYSLGWTSIGSSNRYEGWAANFDTMTYGFFSRFMEVGVNTVGLSPFLNKLFGPRGVITSNKSFFDLLKRNPRSVSPQDFMLDIFKKLRIKARNMDFPSGHLYFKMMGHELRYFDFSDTLRDITTAGKVPFTFDSERLRLGMPVDIQKVFFLFNSKFTLPTTAGYPVSIQLQVATNVKVHGTVAFRVTPYLLEDQRQGGPPTKLSLEVDLEPKTVTGFYGSMGLDAFFVKSTHGFYGLFKMETPWKQNVEYDLVNHKLFANWMMPDAQAKPLWEMKMEPVSERYILTSDKETPIVMYERTPVYNPVGHKIRPLYIPFDCHFLGWRVEIDGQMPRRAFNPMMPFTGRSLLNFYLKPLDRPATVLTFNLQWLKNPIVPQPLSYARTYQETMSQDTSREPRFDKFGRPLPTNLDDILPYQDPVDLRKETITMAQLVEKFQQKLGKPMTLGRDYWSQGWVWTLEAIYKDEKRQIQAEVLYSTIQDEKIKNAYVRWYRTPITGFDEESFEFVTELGISYPFPTRDPVDVYSVDWQRALVQELKYHTGYDTAQVANNMLNQTLISALQRTNYWAWNKITAYRTLEGMIPQRLWELNNFTKRFESQKSWDSYWTDLMPLYDLLVEEDKLSMDPYFATREGMLIHKMEEFLRIQARLKSDFEDILQKNSVVHMELPIMQWVLLRQDQALFMFNWIVRKDSQKGMIVHLPEFQKMLRLGFTNGRLLTQQMRQILIQVNTVSQEFDNLGEPIMVTKSAEDKLLHRLESEKYDIDTLYRPRDVENPNIDDRFVYPGTSYVDREDQQQPSEHVQQQQQPEVAQWDILKTSLYKLTLFQIEVIDEIQTKLNTREEIDFNAIDQLVAMTQRNITFFDHFFKSQAVVDETIIDELLVLTVGNEFIVRLLEEFRDERALYNEGQFQEREIYDSFILKISGLKIAPRVAYVHKAKLAFEIMAPELKKAEMVIWGEVQTQKRTLMVQERWFGMWMAYNITTMRNEKLANTVMNTFTSEMYQQIIKVNNLIDNLIACEGVPPVYLVSEMMELVNGLKVSVEWARWSVLPVTYHERLDWITTLDTQATKIQGLMGKMYPLFDKYSERKPVSNIPIMNTVPVDVHTLDLEDVVMQQNQLLEQIRHFLSTPMVPVMVQQKLMDTAVDRLSTLAGLIADKKMPILAALGQYEEFERSIIASIYSKALNLNRVILEIIKSSLEQRRDVLQRVPEMSEKLTSMEYDLGGMESELNDKLYDIKSQQKKVPTDIYNYNDDYQTMYGEEPHRVSYGYGQRSNIQPIPEPYEILPPSIKCLVNITWGSGHVRDKKAILQVLAMRSVEQVFYLYRQLNAVVRSQDLIQAVEDGLQGKAYDQENMLRSLNTYNHIHSFLRYNPDDIPDWLKWYSLYMKDWVKATLWNNYQWLKPVTFTPKIKAFQAVFDISDFNENFDLYLLDSFDTSIFTDVHLTKWIKKILPNQGNVLLRKQIAEVFMPSIVDPVCYVNKDKIQTFDTVRYRLTEDTDKCMHLLAMDCSDEKTFAITMVKSNTTFEGHILRIANDDKIIDVIPGFIDVQVMVNDETLLLKENEPIKFQKQLAYQMFDASIIIVRKGLRVEIELVHTGVKVVLEGSFIKIEVSPLFRNRLCGLCSNFDSQLSWEYEGPLREVYTNPIAFAQSYVIHSETCPLKKSRTPDHLLPEMHPIPPPLHKVDYSKESQTYRDVMAPFRPKGAEPKFMMKPDEIEEIEEEPIEGSCQLEYEHVEKRRGRYQTCISLEPMPKCPFDCPDSVSVKKEKIDYVCVKNKHPVASQLKSDLSMGPIDWKKYDQNLIKRRTIKRTFRKVQSCRSDDF